MMRYLIALAGLVVAAAGSAATIAGLAVTIGLGPALGFAAVLIVLVGAIVQRHLRGPRAMHEASRARRPATLPLAVAAGAFVVIAVISGLAATLILLEGVHISGSGGIGSVSAGISEALVETALAMIIVPLAVWIAVTFGGRRDRTGDDSK